MQTKGSFNVISADESNGFLLQQITVMWQQKAKKLLSAKYKLTHAQFVILASIYWMQLHELSVTQIALSNHTKMEVMNVSQVLRALEKPDLVMRHTNKKDSRAKEVNLTKKGEELISKALEDINKLDDKFFGVLSAEKDRELNLIFKKLIEANKDF